jgi:HAD superfamily hydrolase (TIGR01549 family)
MAISDIRGIIFDLGYTLINYKETGWPEVRQEALQGGYSKLSVDNDNLPDFDTFVFLYQTKKEECRSNSFDAMLGWNIVDVVKELLDEFKIKESSNYSRIFVEAIYAAEQKQMIIDKCITDTLEELKNRNYRIGIISNTIYPAFLHENDMERFGWKQHLDFQIYSSQCSFRKPHPSIFEAGIRMMDMPADEIMYVGDRYRMDALGAQRAGLIPVIKYCRKQNYPSQWPVNIPIIQNISELPNMLNT